jgi:hypothetical protein
MTANQFNAALVKCGFPTRHPVNGTMSAGQVELARALGLGERTVRRWATGKWPVPAPIAALLNLMLDTGAKAGDLKV